MIAEPRPAAPAPWIWSKRSYYDMWDAGLFQDRRVELIEGTVYEMPPIGSRHFVAAHRTQRTLQRLFGRGCPVVVQAAFNAGERSEPQPDVFVIHGEIEEYEDALPDRAALIVEIADSSLDYDRTVKARIYAGAGVPEYWIVNLVHDRLEIRRGPVPNPSGRFGLDYGENLVRRREERISPLGAPGESVAVSDLLPSKPPRRAAGEPDA